jgi:hypothetical protein
MKPSDLSKAVGAGVLSLSLALAPVITKPVLAQTNNGTGTTNTTTDTTNASRDTTLDNTRHDHGFNWGWLGLIGLAGLAGLAPKRQEPVPYRDPNPASRTGYND